VPADIHAVQKMRLPDLGSWITRRKTDASIICSIECAAYGIYEISVEMIERFDAAVGDLYASLSKMSGGEKEKSDGEK